MFALQVMYEGEVCELIYQEGQALLVNRDGEVVLECTSKEMYKLLSSNEEDNNED